MEAHILFKVSGWEDTMTVIKVFTDREKAEAYHARINLLLQRARLIYGNHWHDSHNYDEVRGSLPIDQKKAEDKKAIRQLHLNLIIGFRLESYPIS